MKEHMLPLSTSLWGLGWMHIMLFECAQVSWEQKWYAYHPVEFNHWRLETHAREPFEKFTADRWADPADIKAEDQLALSERLTCVRTPPFDEKQEETLAQAGIEFHEVATS